ncbi:type IX secretion system protein PorQ [Oscillatoria amoena NRMC-F 0135]|nr:type IX secretion system protein PorQ [Oscillatoria amoena NRMC-F 0135]
MKSNIVIALVHVACFAWSQSGGNKSFQFLEVPAHARLNALGGVNISLADLDVNFAFNNPTLVGDTLAGQASAGYLFYLADIGQATFTYAHDFKNAAVLTFGVRHVNYGELVGYDATGMETGSFKSGETEILIGKSHQVGVFRLGVNFKGVFSNLAGFRSSAFLADLGGMFVHPHLAVGLVIRNFGFVLNEFSETSDTSLPFDVQAGTTFKPEHMPIRFSFTMYNLARLGKTYENPVNPADDPSSLDKILQHVNMGIELLIHKHVNLLAGYNSLRQQELSDLNGGGMRGFTFGFSVRLKQVECVVSRASYSVGNATYGFTLNVNTKSMLMKRKEL